jgi:VWFA-related protein
MLMETRPARMGAVVALAALMVTVVVLVCTVAVEGQDRFAGRTDVVVIGVSVLDADRRPVEGLTASDFVVLEDGRRRPISVFEPVTLPPPPTVTATWQRDVARDVVANTVPRDGRLVILVIDRTVGFDDARLARRIGHAIVDELGPNDLAAVVFTTEFANLAAPQNFTADRARLRAALAHTFTATPGGEDDLYQRGGCPCGLCVMETLTRVAETVRDVPSRRKELFFISTAFTGYAGGVNAHPLDRGAACGFKLRDAREALRRELRLGHVTIHTLDPRGGGVNTGHMLTDFTGGRPVMGTNTPETFVPAIFAESGSYYLIGFEPTDLTRRPDRVRRIDVEVARPGVAVWTRSGYYPEPPDARRRTSSAAKTLTGTLDGVLPTSDLRLQVQAAAIPGGAATVVTTIGVPAALDVPSGSVLRLIAAAFDPRGRQVGSAVSADMKLGDGTPATAAGELVETSVDLALPAGRYEIRVAAETADGRVRGSVFTFVDVPDVARHPLTMSDVFVESERVGVAQTAPEASLPSRLRRRFAPNDRAVAFVRLQQGGQETPQPVPLTMRVIDQYDRTAHSATTTLSADQFAGDRMADARVALPLDSLSRGEYLLAIEGRLGERAVERTVRFDVE